MSENKEAEMRYICANCGYTYDPDQGDPMNDIPPGTAFADLPENWVCPLCYATMDSFDPLDWDGLESKKQKLWDADYADWRW